MKESIDALKTRNAELENYINTLIEQNTKIIDENRKAILDLRTSK